jgi:hypothetical protein
MTLTNALRDFLEGMGSILEIFPPDEPTQPPIRLLTEREAMEADLQQVYQDLRLAWKDTQTYQ